MVDLLDIKKFGVLAALIPRDQPPSFNWLLAPEEPPEEPPVRLPAKDPLLQVIRGGGVQ
jgi:hypothetical protein